MIKMTYDEVTNMGFIQAIQTLSQTQLPVKTAYSIKKIADDLNSVRRRIGDEYAKDLVQEYAKKDEKGQIVHPKDENGVELKDQFDLDETRKEEFGKAQEAFGKREFTIDRYKLPIDQFGTNFTMSAVQLKALEPILDDLENVRGLSEVPKIG